MNPHNLQINLQSALASWAGILWFFGALGLGCYVIYGLILMFSKRN